MPTDAKHEISTKPHKRIDGVDRLDGFEGHRADELVKQWSQNYRVRNPDKLKTSAEIEQSHRLQSAGLVDLCAGGSRPNAGLMAGA
jgi:hypothetical protein